MRTNHARGARLVAACVAVGMTWAGTAAGQLQRATHAPASRVAPSAQRVDGPVVNAPVAPDTIYVARAGATGGLSVVDLNGFGQSTGDPTFDPLFGPASETHTKFPWNPNVALQGSLIYPPLSPGTTTRDGGSAGVFTLTKSGSLDDVLLGMPELLSAGAMMLGRPLDEVFNNSAPFGCQSGGGNLCASAGFAMLAVGMGGPGTLTPLPEGLPLSTYFGETNTISFAPHPNPPPLLHVPLCTDPLIEGQEPSAFQSPIAPFVNLLGPGSNPLGDPAIGVPPTTLLVREQNVFFGGPGANQVAPTLCTPYFSRQQIGNFLYVVDEIAEEVVVVNSNRFTVLDRIAVPDPVELAMDPNLRLLAVTSRSTRRSGHVVFLDIDPLSSTFHTIVKVTTVGRDPAGIAWDGAGEDVLVCNEGDGSLSILSGATLEVRRTVRSGLRRPFAVAISQRQAGFGSGRNVYYAYVLERSGRVALFESGPAGVNGWGYDDVVAFTEGRFTQPVAIQPDPLRLGSAVWIAYRGRIVRGNTEPQSPGTGGVALLVLDELAQGQLPLEPGAPHLRQGRLRIAAAVGSAELSGRPRDIAFDDQRNLGALPGSTNAFSPSSGAINGKSLVRTLPGSGVAEARPTTTPAYLFVAVDGRPDEYGATERIDVVDVGTLLRVDTSAFRDGVQSIPTPGVTRLANYFRQ